MDVRTDVVPCECWTVQKQYKTYDGCSTGQDAGEDGCRTGRMLYRLDAKKDR